MPQKRKPQRRKPVVFVPAILLPIGLVVLLTVGGFTFAATQEQRDSFCSSCHTQPESTYYQRSVSAQPVDLASVHTTKQTRCIDCHSGQGIGGRVAAELMGARNAAQWFTHTAVQPAPLTVPIGDANCLKCHQEVVNQQPDENNHFHVFLIRWQVKDPANAAQCVSCHSGHATDGDPQIAYLNRDKTIAVCQACHSVLREGGE